ncbi:hypothetical protein [Methylophilus sp. DW102]|uniref:hypothetical protein n=1 Tax=Methylophilus sp. DW102 TaxID=3095607 RepID=UPI0030874FCB|nr:hypothetical protein MTDW_18910 [Methylophilus sp. DW102]
MTIDFMLFKNALPACLTLFTSCLFTSPPLHAEQWHTVQGREKFLTVSVDLDSMQVGQHEDIILFKLRTDDHDDTIATKLVQASCSEFSMEVEREVVFHKSELASETLDWKNDQTLKQRPDYASARLSFWGVTQAYGQAISLACRMTGNRAPERLQSMQQDQCSVSNPLYKVACASHPNWRANYKLYLSRSHDVIHNCGISDERMTKQAAWLLKSVMRCQDERCGNEILEYWINQRGRDIASVIHMQKTSGKPWTIPSEPIPLCQSLNQADQAIASLQTEEVYAKAKYLGCLKRETAKLKAASVPAESISQHAEQSCEAHFKAWHDAIEKQAAMLDESTPEVEIETFAIQRDGYEITSQHTPQTE